MEYKRAFVLYFLFGLFDEIEGQFDLSMFPVVSRPSPVPNDYCFVSDCPSEQDESKACNIIIDSFCGVVKTVMYSAEPVCIELQKPLRCTCCFQGGCNVCRVGEASNQYKNEEINILTFGIGTPHIFLNCECDILLAKNYPLMINATDYKLQLTLEVNKLNRNLTKMLRSRIVHPHGQFSVTTRDLLTGRLYTIPALFIWPVRLLVNFIIPIIFPLLLNKYADRIDFLINCPTIGGPSAPT